MCILTEYIASIQYGSQFVMSARHVFCMKNVGEAQLLDTILKPILVRFMVLFRSQDSFTIFIIEMTDESHIHHILKM